MIKKGSCFVITSGEYTSFRNIVFCQASVDIDIQAVRLEYLSTRPEQEQSAGFRIFELAAWLIDRKIFVVLDFCEWEINIISAEFKLGDASAY